MSLPAVEVIGLSKEYRLVHNERGTLKEYFLNPLQRSSVSTHRALDDVSFEIRAGECFGVIGPNGSGKSTLLKVIAGIYPPTRGEIRVHGRLSVLSELGVGFNSELDAYTNIRINGTLLGLDPTRLAERTDAIIAFAGLEAFADQRLRNYSTGMIARLAYSIAIEVPFDVLLLDEIFAVGDRDFQHKCIETIDRFRGEGRTVVLVSHFADVLRRFADRVLVLEHGRIAALGPAAEAISDYVAGTVVQSA